MIITFSELTPIPLLENNANSNWPFSVRFELGKNYLITSPSGKGKTTLVHYIYGLRNDYVGSISIDNDDIKKINKIDWTDYRQKIFSIVFQDLKLFPDLTALDNLLVKLSLTNYKSIEDINRMAEILNVQDLLKNKCSTLSYGQQQRIAIIRSLLQPFTFLLLDEPFSHLDKENIKRACELINEECAMQKAGIIATSLKDEYFFTYEKIIEL